MAQRDFAALRSAEVAVEAATVAADQASTIRQTCQNAVTGANADLVAARAAEDKANAELEAARSSLHDAAVNVPFVPDSTEPADAPQPATDAVQRAANVKPINADAS